ncbi:MAG TPA: hypothetical protein VMS09_11955 [Paenibacillus sp.]|uniref:hypothetical protein n=1 Tax=Paenibacillus sp. TaxID=58172 RepID=UPI0028D7CA53|nr:hypothetical protein [Paenibacillus sp.]HUC92730.1 hypothetical protein [Paenibacillus sp.]
MNTKRKYIFAAVVATFLTINLMIWAATTISLQIDVTPGSTLPDGKMAAVTPLSGSFTVKKGKAQVVNGVELFRLDLGSPTFSDQAAIHLSLLNPTDIGKALNNKNAFIDVAVWYEDSSSAYTLSDGVTKVSKDVNATGRMSEQWGNVILQPTVPGQTRLYILASITVPGGQPPGQQQQLTSLRFYVDVR